MTGEEKYPHIFQLGTIGNLKTKNRIKYAATETNFPYGDGYVSDKEIAYMEAQAKGGAGLVTTQGAYPDPKGEGKGFKGMMAIYDDRFIPGLARIADVIRKHGALSVLQILHCGREGGVELNYCLMPSIVPQKLSYFKAPRQITDAEIRETIRNHVGAARRAKAAGFDMIELSGIVGYLISTFLSRYTNKRTDEYGGDLQNRCRLMVEVIRGIKDVVGDMPVGIRLCGSELLDDRGGNTLDESTATFLIAQEAGADYVSVTVGWHESSQSVITRDVPMGFWLPVAENIRKTLNIPVMMAFRQFLPHIAEKAISSGQIDYWEMCRPMIADPELPLKIQKGIEDEIIPCVACNLCFSRLYYHQPIMCTVRPSLGHEDEKTWGYNGFSLSKIRKRVLVVGGGPAGLQCALVAANKAHDVTLMEKVDELGGAILVAARIDDGSVELLRPIRNLTALCLKAGVKFRLNNECSEVTLTKDHFDVVVIATGATIKETGHNFLTPYEIIIDGKKPGNRIAIIGGRGAGLGTAVYLLRHGDYQITIIEESQKLGADVSPFYLWQYMGIFKKNRVSFLTGTHLLSHHNNNIQLSTPGGSANIEIDSIIMTHFIPTSFWHRDLPGLPKEFYIIGDAKKPRRLHNAIHDGYRMGMVI